MLFTIRRNKLLIYAALLLKIYGLLVLPLQPPSMRLLTFSFSRPNPCLLEPPFHAGFESKLNIGSIT